MRPPTPAAATSSATPNSATQSPNTTGIADQIRNDVETVAPPGRPPGCAEDPRHIRNGRFVTGDLHLSLLNFRNGGLQPRGGYDFLPLAQAYIAAPAPDLIAIC